MSNKICFIRVLTSWEKSRNLSPVIVTLFPLMSTCSYFQTRTVRRLDLKFNLSKHFRTTDCVMQNQ